MEDETLTWVREEAPSWDADKVRVIGGAPEGAFVLPFEEGEQLPGDWWSVRDAAGDVVGYGRLEQEAASRGLNYIHNRIREHEQRDLVHDWLVVRGFRGPVDGDLRKRVGAPMATSATVRRRPSEAYDVSGDPSGRAPGHEEQGGYVDVDEHRY